MGLASAKRKLRLPADTAVDAEVDLGSTDGAYFLHARLNVGLSSFSTRLAASIYVHDKGDYRGYSTVGERGDGSYSFKAADCAPLCKAGSWHPKRILRARGDFHLSRAVELFGQEDDFLDTKIRPPQNAN